MAKVGSRARQNRVEVLFNDNELKTLDDVRGEVSRSEYLRKIAVIGTTIVKNGKERELKSMGMEKDVKNHGPEVINPELDEFDAWLVKYGIAEQLQTTTEDHELEEGQLNSTARLELKNAVNLLRRDGCYESAIEKLGRKYKLSPKE